jgi:hypothetical protein
MAMTSSRALGLVAVVLLAAAPVSAQTIDDGIMLARHQLFVGNVYTHDRWDRYWEGTLERDNGNIGTVTTESSTIVVNYGVTNRLNVISTIPYVWTKASQGVLHGMKGFQDLSIVAKYALLTTPFTSHGTMRAIALVGGGMPLTDYTPDFMPLSIGSASRRLSGRATLNFQSNPGWFGNGSVSYTWREHVELDRPYYYTNGRLTFSNEVPMSDVVDYVVAGGFMRRGLMAQAFFTEQRTRGGGDIRRQDAPFVSNRMNYSKVGASLMYPLPGANRLRLHAAYSGTVRGRNVGLARTASVGLMYLLGPEVGR